MEYHFDWRSKHHLSKILKSFTWFLLTHDNNDAKQNSNYNASSLTSSLSTCIWIDWDLVSWNCWNQRWGRRWWRRKCFWCTTLSFSRSAAFKFLTIVFSTSGTTQGIELTLSTLTDTICVSSCPLGLLILTICGRAMQATSLISPIGTSIWT